MCQAEDSNQPLPSPPTLQYRIYFSQVFDYSLTLFQTTKFIPEIVRINKCTTDTSNVSKMAGFLFVEVETLLLQAFSPFLVIISKNFIIQNCEVKWLVVLGFNATSTAKVISWWSMTQMCFLAFSHKY